MNFETGIFSLTIQLCRICWNFGFIEKFGNLRLTQERMSVAKRTRKCITVTTSPKFNLFEFKWVLEKFLYSKHRKFRSFIDSPVFTIYNDHDKYELQFRVYPIGLDESNKGDVTISFHKISCPREPKDVHVSLLCLTSPSETFTPIVERMMTIDSKVSGIYRHSMKWSQIVERSLLNQNGDLTMKLFIRFDNGDRHEESVCEPNNAPAIAVQNISDDLEELLKSSRFSDVAIIVGTMKFQAHKAILAARSPVFLKMLESPMKESQENAIHVQDIEPDIMAELLRFIYTGRVENISDLAADLLVAADMYQLEALKIMCEETLARDLNLGNVVMILKIVDRYESCRLLRDALIDFLINNGRDVFRIDDIDRNMKAISLSLMFEINKALMIKL